MLLRHRADTVGLAWRRGMDRGEGVGRIGGTWQWSDAGVAWGCGRGRRERRAAEGSPPDLLVENRIAQTYSHHLWFPECSFSRGFPSSFTFTLVSSSASPCILSHPGWSSHSSEHLVPPASFLTVLPSAEILSSLQRQTGYHVHGAAPMDASWNNVSFCASLGLSSLIKVLLTSCLTPQPLYSRPFPHQTGRRLGITSFPVSKSTVTDTHFSLPAPPLQYSSMGFDRYWFKIWHTVNLEGMWDAVGLGICMSGTSNTLPCSLVYLVVDIWESLCGSM